MRETVRQETDQLLDVSARALSSMRNHTHLRREVSPDKPAGPQATQDSLRVFARRVSKGTKRKDDAPARSPGRFELSDVLAAAEGVNAPQLRPSAAASLGALEMVLADLAIDLNSLLADGDDAVREANHRVSGSAMQALAATGRVQSQHCHAPGPHPMLRAMIHQGVGTCASGTSR